MPVVSRFLGIAIAILYRDSPRFHTTYSECEIIVTIGGGHADPEIRTIAWPNGADFAPEFLRSLLEDETPVV